MIRCLSAGSLCLGLLFGIFSEYLGTSFRLSLTVARASSIRPASAKVAVRFIRTQKIRVGIAPRFECGNCIIVISHQAVGVAEDKEVIELKIRVSAHCFPNEIERLSRPSHIRPDFSAMRHHEDGWIQRQLFFAMAFCLVELSFDDGDVGEREIDAGSGVIDRQGLSRRIGGKREGPATVLTPSETCVKIVSMRQPEPGGHKVRIERDRLLLELPRY